jgi:DNA-binding NarL/FixJ family response regulator
LLTDVQHRFTAGRLVLAITQGECVMKLLVVDDHPLIPQAISQALHEFDPSITLLTAANRNDAERMLALHPDCALVLLDLALPGTRGMELLASLVRDHPQRPVVVLSATHDRATVDAAMAAGARGFIAKTADAQEVVSAIGAALAGKRPVTRDFAPRVAAAAARLAPGVYGLTGRQADVLQLLIQGKPNKMICRDLSLSEGTVKVHVSAILKALNVHSRTQAVVELAKRGVGIDATLR